MISVSSSLCKQDSNSCPASGIDLQGGSKEREDLRMSREVKSALQSITITFQLSDSERLRQAIIA